MSYRGERRCVAEMARRWCNRPQPTKVVGPMTKRRTSFFFRCAKSPANWRLALPTAGLSLLRRGENSASARLKGGRYKSKECRAEGPGATFNLGLNLRRSGDRRSQGPRYSVTRRRNFFLPARRRYRAGLGRSSSRHRRVRCHFDGTWLDEASASISRGREAPTKSSAFWCEPAKY